MWFFRIPRLLFCGIVLILGLIACEPEEVEVDPDTAGSMTCTLNGSAWSAISFKNKLRKFTTEPKGKRLDVRARGMGIEITLAMTLYTNTLDNSMPLVTYKTNSGTYGALVVITNGALIPTILGSSEYGEITVTAMNPAEKKISGIFHFTLHDPTSGTINYTAVDGVFTDLIFELE